MLKWLAEALLGRSRAASSPDELRALASLHFERADWPRAADAYRAVVEAEPLDAQSWNKLGFACKELGELEEASRCFERTVELAPGSAGALGNAASALRDLGRVDEALERFRAARRLAPDDLDLLSATLFTMNLSTRLSREEIYQEHLETERLLGASSPREPLPRPRRQKLRIGYFSPDLRHHPVASFVAPLLEHHDRSRFEASCYYLYPRPDEVSERLAARCDRWVDGSQLGAAELAARIRADGIDVLVDLAGHTDWNGLRTLALKPAPVVATWLGYLNTTGLRAVDYRITDPYCDPPGTTERFHSEKLARLPQTQWCREKPAFAPALSPLPASRMGELRFGSFNKSSKLTPETLSVWARLLRGLPRSTLFVAGMQGTQAEGVRAALGRLGIAPERLEFAQPVPLEEFLRLHERVDFALDAYPYSGATTTLDSAWMGVPTLTRVGEAPISRSSASILAALGLEDWIARSEDEFIAAALRHAGDLAALSSLRARLRGTLERSILMDGERFTRQVEALYLQMWEAAPG